MSDNAKSIYIAGPMRGLPSFNFPAFARAAALLRLAGHVVISPHEHDLDTGFDPTGMTGHEDLEGVFDLRAALAWDLEQVASVDLLVLLPGWEGSSGVAAELTLAAALGKQAAEFDPALGLTALEGVRPARDFLPSLRFASSAAAGGEERVVNAETGGEKGSKLARFDLIPVGPLTELAEHFGRGAQKYADRNWERGYDWRLSFAALMRHAWAFWGGEDRDPETGSKHIIAAAWHAFALAEFMDRHPSLDDRPVVR